MLRPWLTVVVAGSCLGLVAPPADGAIGWRIYTERAGIHQVFFGDLPETEAEGLVSHELALTSHGQSVPIRVLDGGDGNFGPGDSFQFAAEALRGEHSHFHDYSRFNVYNLALDSGARLEHRPVEGFGNETPTTRPVREHLERDELLARIDPAATGERNEPELWYWSKLSHADAERIDFLFEIIDPVLTGDLELRIDMRGLSRPKRRQPPIADHRLEVWLNHYFLGALEWDHRRPYQAAFGGLDPGMLKSGANLLQLHVPTRVPVGDDDPLVDVQLLNWFEVTYPRKLEVSTPQTLLDPEAESSGPLILGCADCQTMTAFSDTGDYWSWKGSQGHARLPVAARRAKLHLMTDGQTLPPAAVEPDRLSNWRDAGHGADYLMIGPAQLLEPVEPLAALHRRRGLRVTTLDVQDVYDEFNYGIAHPSAIRDLLLYATKNWQPPAPRFLLLVGDASWDSKHQLSDDTLYANRVTPASERAGRQEVGGRRFTHRRLTPYETEGEERGLVPTWTFHSHDGHSASDNKFVTLDGGHLPQLAVGRFPVVEPEEVRAIVAKTLRYIEHPPVGDWRRRTLWITSDDESWQRMTDRLADTVEARGFTTQKIYPGGEPPTETAEGDPRDQPRESIQQALNGGQLLVHFIGHGGRFIWRAGVVDTELQGDLFSIEHVNALQPSGRLPVVLSMTCFSAPFDHPTADSIGERFLALEGAGAVAVIAASWRNRPAERHSEALLQAILENESLGEAMMRAKRQLGEEVFAQQYHLLGDPALPLARPASD